MDERTMLELMERVARGDVSPREAAKQIKIEPFQDLGYAKVDHHRTVRQGAGEVVYGAGKTPEQIAGIARALMEAGQQNIIITRMSAEAAEYVSGTVPLEYCETARFGLANRNECTEPQGLVVIASAGTSDMPVAEEAALTASALGSRVERLYDAGVAGIHRLFSGIDKLTEAKAVVAVAGMEGALASVVGGLVECPVIAVPTSVGYGASFGGIAALLAMLNSCASGVSVVNIDNGFGAGYLAHMINRQSK